MRSRSGIKMNWPVVAIAFAVIGVPMGVALIQDLGDDTDDEELLARIGEVDDISAEAPRMEPEDEDEEEAAGSWRQPAMEQAFFDEVFLGGPEESKPALRGPLAGIDWARAPAAAPDLSRWPRARSEVRAGDFDQRTASVEVFFPDDGTAARVLASRWGEPRLTVGVDDLARRIWTNPAARLRLVLESRDGESHATFSPFVPAAEYVGQGGQFAFERHPILGATARLLEARYAGAFALEADGSAGSIDCPGVELSAGKPTCTVWFAGGEAVRLTVAIDHAFDPQAGPEVFAALRDAIGPVRDQASDDLENRWTFDRGYTVTQRVGLPVITVERVAR